MYASTHDSYACDSAGGLGLWFVLWQSARVWSLLLMSLLARISWSPSTMDNEHVPTIVTAHRFPYTLIGFPWPFTVVPSLARLFLKRSFRDIGCNSIYLGILQVHCVMQAIHFVTFVLASTVTMELGGRSTPALTVGALQRRGIQYLMTFAGVGWLSWCPWNGSQNLVCGTSDTCGNRQLVLVPLKCNVFFWRNLG